MNSGWSITPAYDSSEHREAATTNEPAINKDSTPSPVAGPSDQDLAFIGSQFEPERQVSATPTAGSKHPTFMMI
ncbi:unnamed protein product [Clonostachys rosea]|uniref:Uncharacterized protein n=1 Tax=Bionectria ochroleuca TaxID=29856 RepID=A0ABY6UNJ0_BIOOC|nr:unnamed protein product [Clonostachys rosea]